MTAIKKKTAKKKTAKRAKKKTAKKAPRPMAITPKNLTPADYNPREMDDSSRSGLNKSMEEFNDISGITWNRKTGNIITGHHRWEQLCELHGLANLEFTHLIGDKHSINVKDSEEDTGYILRVVEWDIAKEKAANVSANSSKIEGIFTIDLKDVLEDISSGLDGDVFADLRLDDLLTDFSGASSPEWSTDITDTDTQQAGNLDGIITTIKIECAQDTRSELFVLLSEFIESSGYGSKVKIK